jgi:redox-sensing transcriptional repressor
MIQYTITKATLGRLPMYLQYLRTQTDRENISATTIAKALNLGEVQVRKDLSSVSGGGKPKVGYVTSELAEKLEDVLGRRSITSAVVVGAGRLGKALLNYNGFHEYGLQIPAAFDIAVDRPATLDNEKELLPISEFPAYCAENNVRIGIIAVPKDAAQDVCDMMVKNNIAAIWNFAPYKLSVPENVVVRQENLALSLAYLNLAVSKEQ